MQTKKEASNISHSLGEPHALTSVSSRMQRRRRRLGKAPDRVPRLYTYVVDQDTGMAPNPYWGWCTLAVCTPNHQGSLAAPGDWIAGFLSKERGNRFLYAMEVLDVRALDDYYRDPRFRAKRPILRGTWKQRCGDNFYSRNLDGEWIQHRNRFHHDEAIKRRDTRYAEVFVAQRFWYLGKSAACIPPELAPLAGGRGARVNHDPRLVLKFRKWVEVEFKPGISGLPNDNPDMPTQQRPETERCVACHGRHTK